MVCRVTLMDDQIMKRSIHHQLGTLSPISASAQLAVAASSVARLLLDVAQL